MLTKIYTTSWMIFFALALILVITGNMTMLALVVFGFFAFGLVFMGMMGVLPSIVAHANHPLAEEAPTGATQTIRGRIRDYKETVSTEAFAVRKPKFP